MGFVSYIFGSTTPTVASRAATCTLLLSQRVSVVEEAAVQSLNDGGEMHSPLRDNPQPGRWAAGGCESDKG